MLSLRSSLAITILTISCIAFIPVLADDKPDMVVEVFRHGARAPTNLTFDKSWGTGGHLTSTGIRQVYTLGLMMGKKYSHLLDEYSTSTIHVRSSASQRAIMSASAHVFGAFQNKGPSVSSNSPKDLFLPPYVDQDLVIQVQKELESLATSIPGGFQPTILQYPPIEDDKVLFVGPWACAVLGPWQANRLHDDYNNEVYVYLSETVNKLQELGYDVKNIEDLKEFGDTLIDNHWDNRELPAGVQYGDSVYNDAEFAFQWFSNYNYVDDAGFERVVKALGLLDQIVTWFNSKAEGTNPLKFAFMSAHDTTLLPILGLYNITDPACLFENYKNKKAGKEVPFPDCKFPVFASNIVYELYNKPEGAYVKFLYNGKPFKICDNGTENGCSLEEFAQKSRELLMGLVPADFSKICNGDYDGNGVVPADNKGFGSRTLLVIVAGLCVFAGVCFIFMDEKKEREEEQGDLYYLDDEKNIELSLLVAKKASTNSKSPQTK